MDKSLKHILSATLHKDELVSFLKNNQKLFEETVRIALGDEEPQAWRAAWLLKSYITKNDLRIHTHINSILKTIGSKKDGHQREFLKILLKVKLTEKQEGVLFDKCISIWEDISKSPSVRGTAFSVIVNIIKKYPELFVEIEFLTQNHYLETLSPGIKSSIVKTIKKLKMNS